MPKIKRKSNCLKDYIPCDNLIIYKAGNCSWIVDSLHRDAWKYDVTLPQAITCGESGDETDALIELLYFLSSILDPNSRIEIKRRAE